MKSNTLLSIFGVIGGAYGAVAVLAPGFLAPLLWPNAPGANAHIMLQGWGAALFGLAAIAWAIRPSTDAVARRAAAYGFFLYFLITAVAWLVDALHRGWAPLGVASFGLVVLFAIAFGWQGFGAAGA